MEAAVADEEVGDERMAEEEALLLNRPLLGAAAAEGVEEAGILQWTRLRFRSKCGRATAVFIPPEVGAGAEHLPRTVTMGQGGGQTVLVGGEGEGEICITSPYPKTYKAPQT